MRTIALLITVLLAAGCAGTNFSFDDASRVQVGMTEQQVTQILGPPYSVVSRGNSQMWVWSHANGMTGSARSVSFEMSGGKVVSVPTIPGSFAGTSQIAVSSQAGAEQASAQLSRKEYKAQQAQQLMQQNLPYDEYMKKLRAIEDQPD